MAKKKTINVQRKEIGFITKEKEEYINLTDMAKGFEGEPKVYLRNWLGNGSTIEFLGVWEKVHNPRFKVVEFHHFKSNYTKNSFIMSVKKWIEATDAGRHRCWVHKKYKKNYTLTSANGRHQKI